MSRGFVGWRRWSGVRRFRAPGVAWSYEGEVRTAEDAKNAEVRRAQMSWRGPPRGRAGRMAWGLRSLLMVLRARQGRRAPQQPLRAPNLCVLWCARPSLVSLVNCEVFIVRIAGSSRSEAGGGRGDPDVGALRSEGAGRSESEPDSASKRNNESGPPAREWVACYRRRSNQHAQPAGSPGWLGAARAERLAEEPGRSGVPGETRGPARNHKRRSGASEVGWTHWSEEAV